MSWMSLEQFAQFVENPKCDLCDKDAKWFGLKDTPVYCDDHFPYKNIDNVKISVLDAEKYIHT